MVPTNRRRTRHEECRAPGDLGDEVETMIATADGNLVAEVPLLTILGEVVKESDPRIGGTDGTIIANAMMIEIGLVDDRDKASRASLTRPRRIMRIRTVAKTATQGGAPETPTGVVSDRVSVLVTGRGSVVKEPARVLRHRGTRLIRLV